MGFLDEALRKVSTSVVGLFTDDPALFTREVKTYNAATATETSTSTSVQVKTTPPLPITVDQMRGNGNLVATDLVVYASSADFEAASFDPKPDTEVKVFARIAGRDHSVMQVLDYRSGDQSALLEIILRS